jgi:hypothetical protein
MSNAVHAIGRVMLVSSSVLGNCLASLSTVARSLQDLPRQPCPQQQKMIWRCAISVPKLFYLAVPAALGGDRFVYLSKGEAGGDVLSY